MSGTIFLFTFLVIAVFVIVIELSQWISQKLSIPQVLGEILAGIFLGASVINFFSFEGTGDTILEKIGFVTPHEMEIAVIVIEFIAEAAALFLLFEIGLEMDIKKLARVGWEAVIVATTGMLLSFLFGFGFFMIFSDFFQGSNFKNWEVATFLGAVLTATSIGISIRLMIDMGRINTRVTRVLVASAIVDDILALMIYSLLIGVIYDGAMEEAQSPLMATATIMFGVFAYFIIVVATTKLLLPRFYSHAKKGTDKYFTLTLSLSLIFFFAWLAGVLYLAPIIGAFVAGIIVGTDKKVHKNAEELLRPISHWFVPFFFISVGLRMNIGVITSLQIAGIGLILATGAILAKVIGSGLGAYVFNRKARDAVEVGLGMSPRGEVILLLSTELLLLGVFSDSLFSMIAILVMISSLVVPIALKILLRNSDIVPAEQAEPAEVITEQVK